MSNVQLSSIALERLVARRTFPLHKRTTACRNLFGPVDHDDLKREMKTKLREISERDQQRWNFNFEANTPLDGNYEWVESPVDKTPVFYQDSVQIGRTRVLVTPIKPNPSPDSSVPETTPLDVLERLAVPESSSSSSGSSSSNPSPVEVNQENRTDKLNSGKQSSSRQQVPCARRKRAASADSNNTHITDFFVKRKRAADMKTNDLNACHLSKSPIPVEQTPRKRIR
ncbi:cyclin-dependent kinase inhibitor 1C-like [Genypterus blacodes]|uniref:cyclin-dependent kinase inhibitor 1C-like n=1 Tax=Genypterus blacodes TaxID=154954 RepID=UPI003F76EF4B